MGELKQNSHLIEEHIKNLKKEPWLVESQKWWVDHLFHFTDILNAVEILKSGFLRSRTELDQHKLIPTDIASSEIISNTDEKWKDYVRLYFRPRTPMQYRNEGFRPIDKRELGGAHCPIPIIFIFNSIPILTDSETSFSEGNLAAGSTTGKTTRYYLSLPFNKIYHEGSVSDDSKRNIIFHRHAEVIIPKQLDLSNLKHIWCRSQAEYETLKSLLPDKIYNKWIKKIGVSNRGLLFFAKWTYIIKVDLSSSSVKFLFNPSIISGTFNAKLEITETETGDIFEWEDKNFKAERNKMFSLSNLKHPERYIVKFWLDDHIAYQNLYDEDFDIPF